MNYQFKRLLDLVRRTGDRLVVTDPNGEDAYVLMGLEAYENLAVRPLSELGMQGRLRDFEDDFSDDYYDEDEDYKDEDFALKSDWGIPDGLPTSEAEGPVSQKPSEASTKEIWEVMPPAGSGSETWNQEKFGREEKKLVAEEFENPEFSRKPAEKEDNEPGEEQFYLEPVE